MIHHIQNFHGTMYITVSPHISHNSWWRLNLASDKREYIGSCTRRSWSDSFKHGWIQGLKYKIRLFVSIQLLATVISLWLTNTAGFLYLVWEMATKKIRLPFSYNIDNSRRPHSLSQSICIPGKILAQLRSRALSVIQSLWPRDRLFNKLAKVMCLLLWKGNRTL